MTSRSSGILLHIIECPACLNWWISLCIATSKHWITWILNLMQLILHLSEIQGIIVSPIIHQHSLGWVDVWISVKRSLFLCLSWQQILEICWWVLISEIELDILVWHLLPIWLMIVILYHFLGIEWGSWPRPCEVIRLWSSHWRWCSVIIIWSLSVFSNIPIQQMFKTTK